MVPDTVALGARLPASSDLPCGPISACADGASGGYPLLPYPS